MSADAEYRGQADKENGKAGERGRSTGLRDLRVLVRLLARHADGPDDLAASEDRHAAFGDARSE